MTAKILEASGTFTRVQKTRKISWLGIGHAQREFGPLVAEQMKRDKRSGFAFWDSCSMIEQAWGKLSDKPVINFIDWALETLKEVK